MLKPKIIVYRLQRCPSWQSASLANVKTWIRLPRSHAKSWVYWQVFVISVMARCGMQTGGSLEASLAYSAKVEFTVRPCQDRCIGNWGMIPKIVLSCNMHTCTHPHSSIPIYTCTISLCTHIHLHTHTCKLKDTCTHTHHTYMSKQNATIVLHNL